LDRVSETSPAPPRNLELPSTGPGAAGGLGRRVAALFIDWFACLAVALLINGGIEGRFDASLLTLAIFFCQVTLLTWLSGASFGQRIMGLVVAPVGRPRIGLPGVALRTLLLCLVIPAVVMQPNGRGLHDLAAGSVVVRR
jgi:uncharacterized RDD family membrane protein YckC